MAIIIISCRVSHKHAPSSLMYSYSLWISGLSTSPLLRLNGCDPEGLGLEFHSSGYLLISPSSWRCFHCVTFTILCFLCEPKLISHLPFLRQPLMALQRTVEKNMEPRQRAGLSLGCYANIPQTGGLQLEAFISHISRVWEFSDQGANRPGVRGEPSSWLAGSCFLIVSSNGRE